MRGQTLFEPGAILQRKPIDQIRARHIHPHNPRVAAIAAHAFTRLFQRANRRNVPEMRLADIDHDIVRGVLLLAFRAFLMAGRRRLRLAPCSSPSRELLTRVYLSGVGLVELVKIKSR